MAHTDSVCIEDFCGRDERGVPTSFWADYFPTIKTVTFGGDWCDVPDMNSDTEPTEKQVWDWARKHSAFFA